MKVEIWSDIMCPFCYLGKKRFADALAGYAGRDDVEVEWKSFQLMPFVETEPGLSVNDLLAREKGISRAQAAQMNEQITRAGAAEGLVYDFDRAVVANTFNAHRLIKFAATHGNQSAVVDGLFRAYFAEGRNVDDLSTLLEIGVAAGLERSLISEALGGERYADEVERDIGEARALGIGSVPFFVFDRKYAVVGAQPRDVFTQALTAR
jgi:predicted DsbA family dithiol-disulfide isomerase